MSKRKTMYKIELCTELQVGQRIAVVEKYGADHTTIRIGYVDSYSASKEQIYVDYRWRNDRGVPLWYNAGGVGSERNWDLVFPYENQVEIYVTNMKLHQICAAMQKRHPDWKWIRGLNES